MNKNKIKMTDKELLEKHGWTLECESPLEISHEDGSFARHLPAELLIESLRELEKEEHTSKERMKNFDLEKFKEYVNTYENQVGYKDYEESTIINDFLYGIGICLNEQKYKMRDGYDRFKIKLKEYVTPNASSK